jgi:gluconolactonase
MFLAEARLFAVCLLLPVCAGAQESSVEHRIEKIAGGYQYIGGIAWSREGHLYFSDTPRGRINEWTAGQEIAFLPVELKSPAGLAVDDHGRLIVCEAGARRIVRIKAGNLIDAVVTSFEGHPLNSPRDLAVRKDGIVFFIDPAFGSAHETMALSFHGIYRLNPKGEAVALAHWDKRPGGIALSPDGKTLYVASSDDRTIHAFDLDRQGNVSGDRVLISGIEGVPIALRTDEKGRLYVAAHLVVLYSPAGRRLGQIETGERPTSLAIGEAGGKTLFVGTRTSIYRVQFGESR